MALVLISMPFGMNYGIERYFLANGADQIDLEDVDFNPFTRRLVLKNLIAKVGSEQVLSVSEAVFTLAWSPFFKKRFLLEKVDLNNSTVLMEELPDGRWRIGGFLPAPSADTSSASPWGFGLAELQIQDSQIRIRSSQLTGDLKIERSRLIRLRSWRPDQKARLEFKGQLNDGQLQFQADFSLFGNITAFDGSAKLNGLTLTPFAQLIAADPDTLQGRLDADVDIQGQLSSANGFSFDQTGRLALNQARMRFGDVNLADENFTWNGTVQVKLPAESHGIQIAVAGQLEGQDGFVSPVPDKLAFEHNGLGWNGKFALHRKTETAELNFDGALTLQKFKMAAPELNLAEESLLWDGNVRITLPNLPEALIIAAAGKMAGKEASVDSPPANFKILGSALNWHGKFAFATQQQKADTKLDGNLKFAKLEVAAADALLIEENLEWDGSIEIFLPETVGAQLTTAGKLESRRQTIALVRENLSLANENLTWKGRFNCGLQDFTAGLAAEGDFSIGDLAVTDTQKKLRLWASKAVSLNSIKGNADTQFSIATAKISGLNLVGQMGGPGESSLFSASEVQVDTVKLERRKQVSIDSARIVDAKGIFHHKSDGRWLYIDDLRSFLADSGASTPKPLPNKTAGKTPPPASEKDVEFGIRIGSLEIIGDSVLHFEDQTVTPAYRTDLRLKKASLTGVNSFEPEQSSPFTLEAASRKYTQLNLQGSVQPFGERISMDFKGKIKAAEMPPLSPYAVKTLGYNLKSGVMDADIDLKITAGKLAGEGDLKFYNPIIEAVNPDKLENKEGSQIPLQSALEVLRDKDNDVRLKIPISGDVIDPKFSVADAINQALIKGLTVATLSYLKYMLGPYGVAIGIIELGAKVGEKALAGIRLNPVDFQPGAADLDPADMEYLEKVAAILKGKKDVRLRLCGWATENDRIGQHAAAETPAAAPLAGESAPGPPRDAQIEPRLPVTDEAILQLAEKRADLIKDILVSQHGINDNRIFICKPEIDEHPGAQPRVEIIL